MRPAFGDWRSLVAHFVRDEGVGGSNPLSPTNSEKPAYGLAFCCPEFNEDEHCRPDKRSAIRRARLLIFGNAGWRRKRLIRPTAQHCRPDKRSAIRQDQSPTFGNAGWRRKRLIRPTGDFAIGKKCASLLTVCSRFCDIFHCLFLSLLKFFFALLMAEPSIFRCAF